MSGTSDGSQRQRPQRLDSLKGPLSRPPPAAQRLQVAEQAKKAPSKICPNPDCQSTNVGEEDGNVICHECGTVVSESVIVTDEVQFAETSNGGHATVGSYIGAGQAYASGGMAGLRSANPDARAATEATGKRYIAQIGTALTISQNLLDSGLNVFRLAAGMNFIQGRETKSVAATCLYIACRLRENDNKHMLIDFADILNLNVFKLGHIYKALLEELRINGNGYLVHPINPENLIWRFAAQLEFGDKQTRVANDAVRIVQRMHRDWMTPGRRPAGICGAALIIAAGMNNFRRTVREMVVVAKVAELTIMKRLHEFTKTGSGNLTVEEFRRIDLERLEDPPAFEADKKKKRGRKRKAIEVDDDGDTDLESQRGTSAAPSTAGNAQLPTPANTQQQTQSDSQCMPPPPIPIDPQLLPPGTATEPASKSTSQPASEPASEPASQTISKPPAKKQRTRGPAKPKKPTTKPQKRTSPPATQDPETSNLRALLVPTSINNPSILASALESTPAPDEEPSPLPSRGPIAMTESISDSEFGPDDTEITNYLLTPSEREVKTRIWTHENRDWIRAEAAKALKRQLAEANGTAPKIKKRIRRRGRMGDMRPYRQGGERDEGEEEGGEGLGGAAEAVGKMLKLRGYSRKINYEAVNKVYDTSSRASSSRRESVSVGAGSPGAATLSVTGAGARSPYASAGSGSPEGEGITPLSMLGRAASGPGAGRRKAANVRVTTPGGTSRSTGPSTPAAAKTRRTTPAPPTPQAGEAEGEGAATRDIPPIDLTTTALEDDDEEADPGDYFVEGEGEGGDGDGEDEDDEDDIEAILAAARDKGEEEEDDVEEWDEE